MKKIFARAATKNQNSPRQITCLKALPIYYPGKTYQNSAERNGTRTKFLNKFPISFCRTKWDFYSERKINFLFEDSLN